MLFPIEDSRRLTGANLYFTESGALLQTATGVRLDECTVTHWRERVEFARDTLGWPRAPIVARVNADGGGELAFAAPIDQLFVATEVNEWAFLSALHRCHNWDCDQAFFAPAFPPIRDSDLALRTLRRASTAERHPRLVALLDEARRLGLPVLLDDAKLSLGAGAGSRTWSLDSLPAVGRVNWSAMHAIPVALVTGSNGKTTTTRLVAAMSELHGLRTAFSCTDGVFVDGHAVASGDYSGPAGARTVLRDRRVQAAVLETARGGILRRGLAVERVQAAIVTNISADHFGEYGIHDLDGLADTKLVVARALDADGTLVLNADDDSLVRRAATLACRLGWFALNADHPLLIAHRARAGATCGVRAGELILHRDGVDHALGKIIDMPLTLRGAATYNIANIAGAALLASALGVAVATIAQVLARFGGDNADNPGRLMRWSFGSATALLDYAHNPEGLRGLLDVVRAISPDGRLALVLGQAGNREDTDIRKLAAAAASFRPDLIVLKDIESHLRGRAPGEIAAILKNELLRNGIVEAAIVTCLDEVVAARTALDWAHAGDSIVLPIHDKQARTQVVALLDRLAASRWVPGTPLPPV
ncbi:MAG TPA: Mur ligase family protein [Rudaea sp.]|jgi:UDP-N-acetylmuramyl tripeptide synthase|uniref:Mur ligase family protein n=1 Tax=Rudaea sp. TaxID=2136325 RepID=UPI002F95848A